MSKKIAILGSTGAVGKAALEVISIFPEEFRIEALSAKANISLLEKQIERFQPKFVAVADPVQAAILRKKVSIPVLDKEEGVLAVAGDSKADLVLSAICGMAGIQPTLAAIRSKKEVALANKEALVACGTLLLEEARKYQVQIIPVDSEHSGLHQCLRGEPLEKIRKIVLTSSGGPLRDYSIEQLKQVTCKEALCHPHYQMGPKVAVDSSTLMNKGLEVIEAHILYGISPEKIEVVIHKEQVIHAFVEWIDGSVMAQMSEPDMALPIQYALCYPNRKMSTRPPFNFTKYAALHFALPNYDAFRCLKLAYAALEEGKSMPCFMNSANEVLVERFLRQEISWSKIGETLETLMERHHSFPINNYEEMLFVHQKAREVVLES